jgi:hypothetical protein
LDRVSGPDTGPEYMKRGKTIGVGERVIVASRASGPLA